VAEVSLKKKVHFQRRDALYRFLGLPPALISGRRVIEFGPGSGHNALFTASLEPARYLLVDGNPRGVAETRANLRHRFGDDPRIAVIESTFEAFASDERFDLVLAEGFLPHVRDPVALLRHLAQFVAPGGVLVITTVCPASILAQNLRRLIRTSLFAVTMPPEEQIPALLPVLGPHLATLRGMSRSHEDWLIDNVIQPVAHAGLLTIPEAITALADDFDAYGSSPAFATDLRWYKEVHGAERGFNERVIACYRRHVAGLVDYRVEPGEHDADLGDRIEADCRALWDCMNAIEAPGVSVQPTAVLPLLDRLSGLLRPLLPDAAAGLDEVAGYFAGTIPLAAMTRFPSFWGRGQQYLSLIRRRPWPTR
jgi:SAM-dependent methyltransferase